VNARHFTLAEARDCLPQVKALMEMVQTARQEILRLRPEVWPILQKAALNGGSRQAGELFIHGQRLENGVKGLLTLGIFVKDVDAGLVDFLGKRDGEDIYLCWKHGEEDIEYWHPHHTGFAGRQPIDALVE
jgi:hypothetical protein